MAPFSINHRLNMSEAQRRSWVSGKREPNLRGLERALQANKERFDAARPVDQIQTNDEYASVATLPGVGRFCFCFDGCGAVVPLLARETSRACPECREARVDATLAQRSRSAAA